MMFSRQRLILFVGEDGEMVAFGWISPPKNDLVGVFYVRGSFVPQLRTEDILGYFFVVDEVVLGLYS